MLNHPVLNRSVLLVVPKPAFYEWSDSLTPDFPTPIMEDYPDYNSYLLHGPIHLDEPEEELRYYWERIFTNELWTYSRDQADYPELSWELFVEWFDLYLSNFAHDLADAPLDHEHFD